MFLSYWTKEWILNMVILSFKGSNKFQKTRLEYIVYCTRICWILNVKSLRHIIFLLDISAPISHTDSCPPVVEMQSIQFKEFKKHYTIVQFVGTVWSTWWELAFTTTVKLQAKQMSLTNSKCLSWTFFWGYYPKEESWSSDRNKFYSAIYGS